jgi:hypothetical protein
MVSYQEPRLFHGSPPGSILHIHTWSKERLVCTCEVCPVPSSLSQVDQASNERWTGASLWESSSGPTLSEVGEEITRWGG